MTYTISIYYKTGDSFGSYDTKDDLGPVWDDLSKAKMALKYIKEHYDTCQSLNKRSNHKEHNSIKDNLKNKPWYTGKYWEQSLKLELDSGKMIETHCFWVGYFEKLLKAEIVVVPDEEMTYEP